MSFKSLKSNQNESVIRRLHKITVYANHNKNMSYNERVLRKSMPVGSNGTAFKKNLIKLHIAD